MDGISRSRGRDKDIPHRVLPMEQLVLSDKWARKIYLIYLYQLVGKIKKGTATSRLQANPWRHSYVKMTLPCRISAFSGFSGSIFHVFPI